MIETGVRDGGHHPAPRVTLVSGAIDDPPVPVSVPRDIVSVDASGDLVAAPPNREMVATSELRADPDRWLSRLVPYGS